jgi:hypothetical protein
MPIASVVPPHVSNFYMDGEAAFIDGDTLDHNPYLPGDEAAAAWRAGWLAASSTATILPLGLSRAAGELRP